jgi:hypothetical protein
MEVVDDKTIRDMIKKGMRNIKGIEIEQVKILKVLTGEKTNEETE